MTTLKIDNFGGEMPSVSPRALPPQAAQTNSNLFLATSEFRPLSEDAAVATIPANTASIYRFARTATGDFNTNPAIGWVTSDKERSYVKGQVNDERTERTYFSTDDGATPLQAITAATPNAPRLVGVPAPMKPAVTHNVNDELTPEEAVSYMTKVAPDSIREALSAAVKNVSNTVLDRGRRTAAGAPTAGPFQMWGAHWCDSIHLAGVYQDKPYYATSLIPYTHVEQMGLKLGELDGRTLPVGSPTPTHATIPVNAMAFAYWIDEAAARANLNAVVYPSGMGGKSGTRVLTDAQITDLITLAVAWFDPENYARALRERLDAEFQAYVKMLVAVPPDAHAAVMDARVRITAAAHEVNKKAVERLKFFQEDSLWAKEWIDSKGGVSGLVGPTVVRSVETRFYLATFVTDWEEESAPSEPTDMLEIDQNDTVTVARPALPPGETFAGRNITKWRLYRSNSGSQTAAFQFVEEVNIATTSYTDSKKAAALGEVCPTTTWAMPPKRETGVNPHIRGLVGMPNGIMAGFFDNTVAFSEPYVPYAWPVEYQITTEFPIVGLGVFGQTLFVGTKGNPYFISGADSANMSAVKLDARQSCASRRSIATVQGGVLYASPDGLCIADPNGVRVVSAALFTREDWQKLGPESMVACSHENIYYLFYTGGAGGCLSFDLASAKLGRVQQRCTAAFSDTLTDRLYVAYNGQALAVFGGPTRRTGRWKSSKVVLPQHASFAWLKVYGDQTQGTPVTVRLYCDGVLRYEVSVPDTQPVRLPAGRWLEYEIELESKARITRAVIAGDTKELQSV